MCGCLADGVYQNAAAVTKGGRRCRTSLYRYSTRHDFRQILITSPLHWFLCSSISGVISGLVYTVKTTGFLSLYNGLGVTLVGSIPKAGIRFGGNAYCKKLLADDKGKLNMAQQFLAGMGAGTIEAILAVTPMETIKTKLIEVIFFFESFAFLQS